MFDILLKVLFTELNCKANSWNTYSTVFLSIVIRNKNSNNATFVDT